MRTAARVVVIALVPLLLAWAVAAAELASHRHAERSAAPTPQQVSTPDDTGVLPGTPDRPHERQPPLADESGTDLYGNEVNDAVAEYGLDASGSLYEMHAPQVELPHLPTPKS